MGRFYDLFHKPKDMATSGVVEVLLPKLSGNPEGYGALMSIDFAACEQTKARSMASLPVGIIEHRDGQMARLDDHPLSLLMNGMANEEMTAPALMSWTVLRRDVFGNAYWFVEWKRNVPVAIWPITTSVTHFYDASKPAGYRTTYTVAPGDDHVPAGTYFNWEVVNLPTTITKDGIKGESLARIAAEEVGLSIDLERFYRSMLRNGNHQLGHVEVPEAHMKPDDLKALRKAVDQKAGLDNAGKAPIFGYGAKWVNDQQTMADANVIEQQKWVLHQVCRACNVPPWKVYEQDNVAYNGGQQQRIDYVSDTIVPETRAIELAMQPVLKACGLRRGQLKFRLQGLMRGDDASRAQYYRNLGYLGTITRADIRDLEDMEPIDGLDAPLFPLNYGTVNPDGSVNVYGTDTPGNFAEEGATE